jgi:hypothetical protein
MESVVQRPRPDIPYLSALIGGALVCIDYLRYFVLVPGLPVYALEYVAVGFTLGVAMVVGAYLHRKVDGRKWLYVLLASSLLSLFLYITIVSSIGAVLGAMSSTYLLSKRRMRAPQAV